MRRARQTGAGCKQIRKRVLRRRFWDQQFQNICSPQKHVPFSTPAGLCPRRGPGAAEQQLCRGHGAPNCCVFWEKEAATPFRPRSAFPTPQSPNFWKTRVQTNYKEVVGPQRRKVSRRKLTTSSCSLKQHYNHQSPAGRATGWQPRNKPVCMTLGRPIDFSVLPEYRWRTIILPFCARSFWSFLFSFRNSTQFCCRYQLFNSFYTKIFVIRNCALICVRLMDSIKALSGEAEWIGLQKWCHQGNWYVNSQSADLATKHTNIIAILFPHPGKIVQRNTRKYLHKY